ncbi:complex I intermediate-associated protein 30-domain-containing protein [Glomus cerebriforme]|uniref:Complex I intermediate-associated protein 30-domain-containing protein n=1 Tax=Glomus cerebriforme TaxID=658196 RepID=A0A397TC11_9GLOM|nr:complex I intermediate-associated protein 30-domain-containing protein [Glomus cerebriforme]
MPGFLKRSFDAIKEGGTKILKANPTPWTKEQLLLQFNNVGDLKNWAIGCDKDIGGFSNARLEYIEEGFGRFHGNISLDVPKEMTRSGYAGIRSRVRGSSLFGARCWDTSLFRYLAIKARGDYKKYFVNIQTDGPIPTDLFQHRLFLRKPGEWETILIPFKDFILTNHGIVQDPQMEMYREKVKTIGFSILGQPGPFCLEIEWIKAMNTDSTEGNLKQNL